LARSDEACPQIDSDELTQIDPEPKGTKTGERHDADRLLFELLITMP